MLKYTNRANITAENIMMAVQETLSYVFKSPALLIQAFTHSTYANEHAIASNEVLEFYGDVVLKLAITDILIREHCQSNGNGVLETKYNEGFFTQEKASIEKEGTLSSVISRLGWFEYLLIGNCGLAESESVKADLFESIIGAVYVDSCRDMEVARQVVCKLFDNNYEQRVGSGKARWVLSKGKPEHSITHGESVDIFLKDEKFWNSNDMADENGLLRIFEVDGGFMPSVTFHSGAGAGFSTAFPTIPEAKADMHRFFTDLIEQWENDIGDFDTSLMNEED